MSSFTFNSVTSTSKNIYVGGQHTFNSPQRDVTKVSIPGRNGDLIRDNGRFYNVEIVYNIVAMSNFTSTALAVRDWLLSVKGYARLEDTYHPDHYRMARVADTIDFETSAYNETGKAQVTFDCKPQRFLKSGETAVTMNKNGTSTSRTITNPTAFESKPLIKVYGSGSGTVTYGSNTITLANISEYVEIDSETMNCYKGPTNCNANVTLGTAGYPVLPSGSTTFSMTGGVTKIEVTGRWWEL